MGPNVSVVLITVSLASLWPRAESAGEGFVPVTTVSFSVATERPRRAVGEAIPLTFHIVNIGKVAVYVPRAFVGCIGWVPHILSWFETTGGQRRGQGYGSSCSSAPGAPPMPVAEQVARGAVRLGPGETFDGNAAISSGMTPGAYRVGATLRGWVRTDYGIEDFGKLGVPFIEGELTSSVAVTLAAH